MPTSAIWTQSFAVVGYCEGMIKKDRVYGRWLACSREVACAEDVRPVASLDRGF